MPPPRALVRLFSRLCLAAACAAVLCPPAAAAGGSEADEQVQRVGRGAGLGAEMITALHQDRAGFLWIGSRQGLYLYDGAGFTRFEHRVDDPRSIGDNTIRTLFEDREGRLWIGTNSAGLDLLDRATWTFRHFQHDEADPASISYDSVNAIAQDVDGRLWVGTQVGLNRFDPARGTFERLPSAAGSTDGPAGAYVYALHVDARGTLWVGTVDAGLSWRDGATGRFDHDPLADAAVFVVAGDAEGRLWLGTSGGICRREPSAPRFTCVDTPLAPGTEPNMRTVTSLAHAGPGRIWVGALGGLFLFDASAGSFARQPLATPGAGAAPRAERVIALLPDRAGHLWVGTWQAGLHRLRARGVPWSVIDHTRLEVPGAADVSAALVDRSGARWLATTNGYLFRRRPGEAAFTPVKVGTRPAEGRSFVRLFQDRAGLVWIGGTGGLTRLDPATGAETRFEHRPGDPRSLGRGWITAIAQDRDGVLWIGTGGSGVFRLRPDGRGFDPVIAKPRLADDYVTVIVEDRAGRLLVGTRTGGLHVLDRDRTTLRQVAAPVATDADAGAGADAGAAPGARAGPRGAGTRGAGPGGAAALSHRYITAVLEDDDGAFWVGTSGGGLDRIEDLDRGRRSVHVDAAEGLVDDDVMSLARDDDGSLWIATRDGLTRFDPRSGRMRNYDDVDGLPSREFNASAVATGDGTILLGTIKGAIEIPRGTPFETGSSFPTVVTSIRTLAGPIASARAPWETDRVQVRYGEALLLDFVVLDYGDLTRHRYAYRLGDETTPWADLGSRRSLTFTALAPGEHRFVLRGRSASGTWSHAGTELTIRVVPPFWRTGWFQAVAAGALVALVLTWHRSRTARLEKRHRELLVLHEERERALTQSRSSEERLREAFGKLRDLTRRLEAAKEEERRRIARELHDEMGQALTAAKITLDMAGMARGGGGGAAQASSETAALLERILDRIRDLSLDLRPPLLDERGLAAALRGFMEAQARRTGVSIDVAVETPFPRLPPEVEIAAFRIAQEAVTNAVRHGGATRVAVRLGLRDGLLELAVDDDGAGFEPDEALARAATGRHLGLLGMRERVELLGGNLTLRSAPGQGASIGVTLPLGNPA